MLNEISELEENFKRQTQDVDQLMNFDKLILDFCIENLEKINDRLKGPPLRIENSYFLADNALATLRNVNVNKSLQPHYQKMYNQGIVLLVSYFTSTVSEMFKRALKYAASNDLINLTEDIKFSYLELKEVDFNVKTRIADMLLKKKEISFQDMQSIHRAFKNYLGIDIPKDHLSNDIIFAQACRHAIIHSLNVADKKLLTQIGTAVPRSIDMKIELDQEFHFTKPQLYFIKETMIRYIYLNVTS
jgi:hypothetical protein